MKALIFDMDGVIVDNKNYHYKAWIEFTRRHNKSMSIEEMTAWFGRTNPRILESLFGKGISEEDIARMGDEKEEIYREIYRGEVKLLEGLEDFLNEMNSNAYFLAIATSAPRENADFILEQTGIGQYFHAITDASMIREGKPDPEIFLATAEKLGTHPADCLVFEDSLHGLEAARRAGMKVVAVATTHERQNLYEADLIITDFRDIKKDDIKKLLA